MLMYVHGHSVKDAKCRQYYAHTHTDLAHTHTHVHMCVCARVCLFACTNIRTHTRTRTHARTYARAHTHTHTLTHTHTHTHTHTPHRIQTWPSYTCTTLTHTYTHTHTQTHTHTYIHANTHTQDVKAVEKVELFTRPQAPPPPVRMRSTVSGVRISVVLLLCVFLKYFSTDALCSISFCVHLLVSAWQVSSAYIHVVRSLHCYISGSI